jgi:hypothetical protein
VTKHDETVSAIAVSDWRDVAPEDKAMIARLMRYAAEARDGHEDRLAHALRTAANLLERIR